MSTESSAISTDGPGRDPLGSWEDLEAGDFSDVPITNLVEFAIDLRLGRVSEARVLAAGAQIDHPKVHPLFEARRCRFVYATCGARPEDGAVAGVDGAGASPAALEPCPTQSFVVVDLEDPRGNIVDSWHAGDRRIVDEMTVVHDAARGEGERDAWLVAPVFDGSSSTTSYVVLDAADLAAGPICELPLDTHIPWGLHGAWLDAFSGTSAAV